MMVHGGNDDNYDAISPSSPAHAPPPLPSSLHFSASFLIFSFSSSYPCSSRLKWVAIARFRRGCYLPWLLPGIA